MLGIVVISCVGVLLSLFSLIMMFNPQKWSQGIVVFSQQHYFHWCEVITRLITGIIFIYHAPLTLNPFVILVMGYLFVFVAMVLILLGETKHKQFAIWSARRFKFAFPVAGICAFPFGIYLVYLTNVI